MENETDKLETENEDTKAKKRSKKSNTNTNTILDIAMFIVMLAIFCLKGGLHEPLAYTIGGLVIVHVILHWRQFTVMLKKGKMNSILDLIMALVMIGLFNIKGDLHETLAYSIGGLVIIHIVLHWQQFKVMYCRLIPEVHYQRLVAMLTVALVIAILTMPLYLDMGGIEHKEGYGHHGDFGPSGHYQGGRHH
ncbi:MAG: hypothetical protein PHX14_13700 [Syntrophomonadaceae bacterium]|nr:hypothetical protein [Syntrophomonadaceae bacterium]